MLISTEISRAARERNRGAAGGRPRHNPQQTQDKKDKHGTPSKSHETREPSYGIVLWVAEDDASGAPDAATPTSNDSNVASAATAASGGPSAARSSTRWWFVLQESLSEYKHDLKLDPLRGKREQGETPQDTAAREAFGESLACLDLDATSLGPLGENMVLIHVVASWDSRSDEPAVAADALAMAQLASPAADGGTVAAQSASGDQSAYGTNGSSCLTLVLRKCRDHLAQSVLNVRWHPVALGTGTRTMIS